MYENIEDFVNPYRGIKPYSTTEINNLMDVIIATALRRSLEELFYNDYLSDDEFIQLRDEMKAIAEFHDERTYYQNMTEMRDFDEVMAIFKCNELPSDEEKQRS